MYSIWHQAAPPYRRGVSDTASLAFAGEVLGLMAGQTYVLTPHENQYAEVRENRHLFQFDHTSLISGGWLGTFGNATEVIVAVARPLDGRQVDRAARRPLSTVAGS